ncbi:MAG: hypothetical protein U0223_16915 [Nitrospira sp.]|nr:hypothetical protein [Nitrospira sp.]
MKKLLFGIAALVWFAITASVWWAYTSLDSQVASVIRRYGSEITGVPIGLSHAKINPIDGKAALYGLVIGNPDSFKTKQALSLSEISMTLDIGSLTTDVILIKELTLIKPEITYEYASGKSNLDVLQQNIERSIGQERDTRKNRRNSKSGKKLIIEHLYVKNATARMSTELLGGEAVSVPIPDLHLQDIGRKSDGVTADEVTKQILGPIIQRVSTAMAAVGVHATSKTIQKAVDSATQAIKDLFK